MRLATISMLERTSRSNLRASTITAINEMLANAKSDMTNGTTLPQFRGNIAHEPQSAVYPVTRQTRGEIKMKRKAKQLLIAAVALAVFALIPAAIKADPVVVTGQGTVTIAQGGSSGFNASVTNNGPPRVYLNSIIISFSGPAGITFSDAPFFVNTPAFLDSLQTTGLVSFFTVFVDPSVAIGFYSGTFTVLGGDTDSSQNELGTQPFTISVVSGTQTPVPEPATMLLLATGLGGAALARRRRAKPQAD